MVTQRGLNKQGLTSTIDLLRHLQRYLTGDMNRPLECEVPPHPSTPVQDPLERLQTAVFELLQLIHQRSQWEVRALVLSYPRNTDERHLAVRTWYPVYCYHRAEARRLDLFIAL